MNTTCCPQCGKDNEDSGVCSACRKAMRKNGRIDNRKVDAKIEEIERDYQARFDGCYKILRDPSESFSKTARFNLEDIKCDLKEGNYKSKTILGNDTNTFVVRGKEGHEQRIVKVRMFNLATASKRKTSNKTISVKGYSPRLVVLIYKLSYNILVTNQ